MTGQPSSAAVAAGRALAAAGFNSLPVAVLEAVASAVLDCADEVVAVRHQVWGEAWADEAYRGSELRRLRWRMVDAAVDRGLLPVELPVESVGVEPFPGGFPGDPVTVVSLRMRCRRPWPTG